MSDVFIALQSLMEEIENQEPMIASVGHHNTIPYPQDVNLPPFHHPQGAMVSQIMFPINYVQSPNRETLGQERDFRILKND